MPRNKTLAFNYHYHPETWAQLVELAQANGRSAHAELDHAVVRHLAAPPRIVTPSLPEVAPPGGRPRGRPRKAK